MTPASNASNASPAAASLAHGSPRAATALRPAATTTASLLYWLLVVCGLAGITLQRLDTLGEVAVLWGGTVGGLALGQILAWARLRVWVLAALGMTALWISPVFLVVFYSAVPTAAEACFYAFLPAAICGYLSLSERGGLLAFWYPAVLWMLVILDGPDARVSTLDTHAALPLVIGLGVLFVAYLRARETRRVALWHGPVHAPASAHSPGALRLATPTARVVLRASPLRAASQHAFTALAGAFALVLAAWVAPQLWQTDHTKRAAHAHAHANANAGTASRATGADTADAERCCMQSAMTETKRARIREYLPMAHGHDEAEPQLGAASACTAVCEDGGVASTSDDYDGFGAGDGNGSGSDGSRSSGSSPPAYTYGYAGGGGRGRAGAGAGAGWTGGGTPQGAAAEPGWSTSSPYADVTPTPTPAVTAPAVTAPTFTPPTFAASPAASPTSNANASRTTRSRSSPTSSGASSSATSTFVELEPATAPDAATSAPPWKAALVLSAAVLALRLLLRAVRRKITLRHLARPFWPETLDQRISNHWERVLIALRDAGIHTTEDEQPEALAKRVVTEAREARQGAEALDDLKSLEGLGTCATILERVRHGVRVTTDDLATMDAAASAVYRAVRARVGLPARAAALVRWPLA